MAVQISAEDIIRMIVQMGADAALMGTPAAGLTGLATRGFANSSASLGNLLGAARAGTASATSGRMSATEYPNPQHTVEINAVGDGTHNAMLHRDTAKDAARMQTLAEHNAALNKFLRPNQTPTQRQLAIQQGVEAEEALRSYWYDKQPRVNYTPSSSAIAAIRVTPEHRVQVQWRSSPGKWYSYMPASNAQEASEVMKQLVTQPSIGRALMRKKSGTGKDGVGTYGDWARKYFDSSFGT